MFQLIRKKKEAVRRVAFIACFSSLLSIYMNYVLQYGVNYIFDSSKEPWLFFGNLFVMCSAVLICDQWLEEYVIGREKLHIISDYRKRFLFRSPLEFRNPVLKYSIGERTNLDRNLSEMVEMQVDHLYVLVYYGLEVFLFSAYLYVAVHWKVVMLLSALIPFALFSEKITEIIDGYNVMISELKAKKDGIFLNGMDHSDWIRENQLESTVEGVFSENLKQILVKEKKCLKLEHFLMFLKESLNLVVVLLVPLFSGYLLWRGEIDPGGFLVATNIYSRFLVPATMSILEMKKDYSENRSKIEEVNAAIESVAHKKTYARYEEDDGFLYRSAEGSFSYSNDKMIRFPAMSFRKSGIYLFKGMSGGGKSSILHILYNYYDMGNWKTTLNCHEVGDRPFFEWVSIASKESNFIGESLTDILRISSIRELEILLGEMEMNELCSLYKDSDPEKLSGGEKELLFILRSLLSGAKMIFLDEPGSALDLKNREKLYRYIKRDSKNRTYLIAYHDDFLDEIAEEIYDVWDGQVEKRT